MKGERKTEQNKIKEYNTKLYKNARKGKREGERERERETERERQRERQREERERERERQREASWLGHEKKKKWRARR